MNNAVEAKSDTRYNIRVLDRAIRLLSLLSDGLPRTPIEISEGIALSPSTTHRILATLSYYNLIKRDDKTGEYGLGLACLELARAYQDSNDLRRVALPELQVLRDEVKETIHLCILDNMEIVYLEKISGLHAVGIMSSRIGGRAPAYCTGVGKVLLAYQSPNQVRAFFARHGLPTFTGTTVTNIEDLMSELEQIAHLGYGFDRGEHEHEVRCIAAPIFDIDGNALAALSIAGPAARMEPIENNVDMIEKAKETAMRISHQLGYGPTSRNEAFK